MRMPFAISAWTLILCASTAIAGPCPHTLSTAPPPNFDPSVEKASDAQLNVFWTEGWPAARRIARDSGFASAKDMFVEVAGVLDLIAESVTQIEYGIPRPMHYARTIELLLGFVEELPRTVDLTDAKDRRRLELAYEGLRSLANSLILTERYKGVGPTFDPFADVTAEWTIHLIDRLQTISIDYAVEVTSAFERAHYGLSLLEPRLARAEAEQTSKKHTTDDANLFATLVKAKAPKFIADHVYTHRIPADPTIGTYDVSLSAELLKELEGAQSAQTVRLLKTMLTPPSNQSGIKTIEDTGKHIVELKIIMKGHWRIIGCLNGNRLRLLKLVDLPNKAAYSKRISPALCAGY